MQTPSFDTALIERYGGRGPRYTSYPTAVQFQPGFGESDYRAEVRRSDAAAPDAPLSLYVHIPFCHSLCYYCGCSKIVTRHAERAEDYLVLLIREIELQGALFSRTRTVEQLHFGGGTPTYLDSAQMRRLFDALNASFSLCPDERREFSIEIDPRTVSPADIAALAESGFNRISMGVQDFEADVQQAVNRIQSAEETGALVRAAREAGFRSLSLDLIYGLPLQTVDGFERTLERVLEMRPDRLAVYSYAHLPQMFRAQRLIHEEQLPEPSVKLEILRTTIERLTDAGYVYIGMDHFALADDELVKAQQRGELQRNFQGYSTHGNSDLVGLGMTSIGQVGDCYAQNAKEMAPYRAALEQGKLPIVKGLLMTADDRIRRSVIQDIMCRGELDYGAVSKRSGIEFERYFASEIANLLTLERDGLIEPTPTGFRVCERVRLLLRAIAMTFDGYLAAHRPQQAFSKII
jgi:oxygen-independent coproporphyrinogen-3 oxidase